MEIRLPKNDAKLETEYGPYVIDVVALSRHMTLGHMELLLNLFSDRIGFFDEKRDSVQMEDGTQYIYQLLKIRDTAWNGGVLQVNLEEE